MRSRLKGHATLGVVSTALGIGAIGAGLMRVGPLASAFVGTPAWALAVTAGSVLLLAGGFALLFSFRPAPEEPDIVPAHVAFNSRMNAPSVVPMTTPRPATAAAPRARPAPASHDEEEDAPGSARLPTPKPQAKSRVAPIKEDIANIDGQIRDLTRRINKAGVMLATGQLSQQGYLAYVEDLKAQRAKLEAQRVRAELRSS